MPISYAPTSWNPTLGCEPVSEGCKNCWAMKLHDQRHGGNITVATAYLDALPGGALAQTATRRLSEARRLGAKLPMPPQYDLPFSHIQLLPARLEEPLHWRTPRTVAVCFMGDLLHEQVPDEFIYRVFHVMGVPETRHHTFLVLTKRAERMRELTTIYFAEAAPLPNVWLGVTAENQRMADERIPLLLDTPGKHWLSLEPLLGAVDLSQWLKPVCGFCWPRPCSDVPGSGHNWEKRLLDWVVVGGESGPGHRPMELGWARDIVTQCQAATVPVYFKQAAASRPSQPARDLFLDFVKEVPW